MKICTKCNIEKENSQFPTGRNACTLCYHKEKNEYQKNKGKAGHKKSVYKYSQSKKGKIVKQKEYKKGRKKGWDMQYIKYNGRARALKSRYGITVEDYNRMLVEQKGVCAICGNPETQKRVSSSGKIRLLGLFVDHNHEIGKVRGLLCNKCNNGLGYFRENVELLANAISYIEKHKKVAEAIMGAGG